MYDYVERLSALTLLPETGVLAACVSVDPHCAILVRASAGYGPDSRTGLSDDFLTELRRRADDLRCERP